MQVRRNVHPAASETAELLRQQELLAEAVGWGKGHQQVDVAVRPLLTPGDTAEEVRLDDAMGPHRVDEGVRDDIGADARCRARRGLVLHGAPILRDASRDGPWLSTTAPGIPMIV